MKEWVSVLRAADAAARWHVHQRRKGSAQEPYINHSSSEVKMLASSDMNSSTPIGRGPQSLIYVLLVDDEVVEDRHEGNVDRIGRFLVDRSAAG